MLPSWLNAAAMALHIYIYSGEQKRSCLKLLLSLQNVRSWDYTFARTNAPSRRLSASKSPPRVWICSLIDYDLLIITKFVNGSCSRLNVREWHWKKTAFSTVHSRILMYLEKFFYKPLINNTLTSHTRRKRTYGKYTFTSDHSFIIMHML